MREPTDGDPGRERTSAHCRRREDYATAVRQRLQGRGNISLHHARSLLAFDLLRRPAAPIEWFESSFRDRARMRKTPSPAGPGSPSGRASGLAAGPCSLAGWLAQADRRHEDFHEVQPSATIRALI